MITTGIFCLATFCGIVAKTEARTAVQSRTQVCIDVAQEAEKQGVSPVLAVAVAWVESSLRRTARSKAGAVGPMQVLTRFWCKETPCDLIEAGVRALRTYTDMYGEQRGLCAYVSGRPCEASTERASAYRSAVIMKAAQYSELYHKVCVDGC